MLGLSLETLLLFCIVMVVVAFLYASVGHGGASGYIALMTLFSFPIVFIKPTALVLNIFIAAVSFWYFNKRKYFNSSVFYPFVLSSLPASFIGGYLNVDPLLYKQVLGVVLFIAILRMMGFLGRERQVRSQINVPLALLFGALIGFFSGMIGIGGGILLSPLLLLLGWSNIKEAAAVSALFIFVNSASGLLGYLSHHSLETKHLYFVPIALIGGVLGAKLGSGKFSDSSLKYTLSFVLVLACIKLTFL